MARPFKPAAAFRTPSMTEATPSSSARGALIEHEGWDNLAGIDGSIGIRKLFLRAEVDGRQFDVEALLGDQDSHAAGIGRAAGMIECQRPSPIRFREKDPR